MRGVRRNSRPTLISLSAFALLSCAPMTDAPKIRPVQSAATSARDMLYESAVSAIDKRDYARALDYLQQARARAANDPRVLNAMGVIYDKLGRFDLSARYYAQARDADPASKIVASNMAYSRVMQGLSRQNSANLATAQQAETAPEVLASVAPVATTPPSSLSIGVPSRPTLVDELVPVGSLLRPIARAITPYSITDVSKSAVTARHSVRALTQASVGPRNPSAIPNGAATPRQIVAAPAALVQAVASRGPSAKPVLTTGHPLLVIDATGHADKARIVGHRLTKLGWTVRASSASGHQAQTQLLYAPKDAAVAQAMQHTLPFPVRTKVDASMAGLKLTIGQDFLVWKPRNTRLAGLWQGWAVTAFLPPSSIKRTNP